jgi:Bacterial protein of unknown function (DUF937)
MSTNLVSTIMQSLSPEAIGKIASSIGLEQSAAQRGISAGIPGMLAGLANTASSSDGAQRLGNAVSNIEDMPGHDIVRNLLSGNTQNIAESGLNIASSLLGSSSLSTLSSVIAQFAGFGQGSAKKLLGLLAPLVLGFLRREQVANGLDSRGLATLLTSQRDNIERAMPAGVSRNLQTAEARSFSQPTASDRFRRPAVTTGESSSSRNWAYWLLPALVAAGVAVYLLPPREETRTAQQTVPPTATRETADSSPRNVQPAPVPASAPVLGAAATSLENDIVANISRLRASLQNIKDTGSAQGALGELKDIGAQFGRLKVLAQQLSPEARKALAAAVAARVPDLNGLIDRIGSDANLGGEAKPAMDNLKSELLSISKV